VAVCAVAISNQSYWIDEAATAYKAAMPTLADWWRAMRVEGNSNLQLPLYMLFSWLWVKLAGVNEFALRAGNAPWFLLGLLVMARATAGQTLLRWSMSLVVLSSPFAWYYLNEARPYALQIGSSLAVFSALFRLGLNQDEPARERRWVIGLCLGSVLLAASGMLAMMWLGAYLGAAMLSAPAGRLKNLARDYRMLWGLTGGLLLALGVFYLWTLSVGARATAVAGTDVKNVVFILYELIGFSGLGPGRLDIRTGGMAAFRPWLPALTIYGALLVVVLAAGWRHIAASSSLRSRLCWGAALMLVAAFIITVGVAVRFRVVGRHFTPVLPVCLFVLGSGVAALLDRRNWVGRVAVAAFVGLSLASGVSLRFGERHAKDDYRGAAALGSEALARGETVWWSANKEGAFVYHLPLAETAVEARTVMVVANPDKDFERTLPKPDLVLASKPDLYDEHGALADFLSRSGFRHTGTLAAFTVWRRPAR
jgi:hypothetical protein